MVKFRGLRDRKKIVFSSSIREFLGQCNYFVRCQIVDIQHCAFVKSYKAHQNKSKF